MDENFIMLCLIFYVAVTVKLSYGCPELCTCINKEVHCAGGKLYSMPMDIPSDTVLLNLENNHISQIRKTTFSHLGALKVLRLANNRITDIEEGAFNDLGSLMKLDLAKNEIQDLPLGIFSQLTSLQLLYLYDNKVSVCGGFGGGGFTTWPRDN